MPIIKFLDMTLLLDENGSASMEYIVPDCGDDYHYSFHFTGDFGEHRNAQAFTIGQEILSWFDMMKERLEEKENMVGSKTYSSIEDILTEKISAAPVEQIEEFLGYQISADVLENLQDRIREVLDSMTDEELSDCEKVFWKED